jgi:hypothetical protein
MANPAPLSDAERAKLQKQRDRLMKLMKQGDGAGGPLNPDDRADLAQEWTRIDNLLQGR